MIIYTTEDGLAKIETTFDGDTVWLSMDQMAELFQRDKSTISRHIKNIFIEGELNRDSVVANFATTAADGKTYQVDYYNLDVIISVGYRVKSKRGTQFRIWATGILKEYMRKGFALDDERLKNLGGGGYFKELLERIRDIRASEKVFYRQVDGYSLDAQKAKMKAYVDYNDYEMVGEYEDAGKSGKSIEDRAQFGQMMEDIKSGKDRVSYVLVFKLSRFGRNAVDVFSFRQVMQDFGVNLVCVEDGIDSSKDAGKLMISALSAVTEI